MVYYLGIGSNLGNREQTIREALRLLDEAIGKRVSVAPLIYTAPQGFASEHEFCNTVARYESALQPLEVLARTQAIEKQLGRTEHSTILPDGSKLYADREIDIDLIQVYDDEGKEITINTPTLTLPHPRMNEREFVLQPLKAVKLLEL
jgi:2-amino-4-hydroxy-6-hydroxymethyldihydropteridine diphosphokinase